jgi:antitoxin (DNA-binding transcriptional repressor) of toxin-antitoxin stability system
MVLQREPTMRNQVEAGEAAIVTRHGRAAAHIHLVERQKHPPMLAAADDVADRFWRRRRRRLPRRGDAARVLVCGSLHFAGTILAEDG